MNECDVIGITPKGRRPYTYNEGVDEPAKLIEIEAVDVEAEVPAEANEPVERSATDENRQSPGFEDDDPSG